MKNSVREQRLALGLTQAELAEKTAVSRQTIISIESGKYVPSAILAIKLARAFGRKVEDIFVLEKND